jgi:3-deoxy-7-phosphoheptulonate synthase
MIIVMNAPTNEQINRITDKLMKNGLEAHTIHIHDKTMITASGNVGIYNTELYERMPGVEKVISVSTPFKLVSREFRSINTIVNVKGIPFGDVAIPIIAGPCAIESYEQLRETAIAVKNAGASILRGGAYKPRTSPYSFQGLQRDGLEILSMVSHEVGIPVVSELTDPRHLDMLHDYVDLIQVGARNMHNYALLKELSISGKPVLLKRGFSATVEEWLMAAEYIMAGGNDKIILCERGIRTYESYTRNTLDLSAVSLVKQLSHLPVIVDPSHGTGNWRLVNPMSKAAVAAGADGLIIEVHPCPEEALSDGPQSLTIPNYQQLITELSLVAKAIGRSLGENDE